MRGVHGPGAVLPAAGRARGRAGPPRREDAVHRGRAARSRRSRRSTTSPSLRGRPSTRSACPAVLKTRRLRLRRQGAGGAPQPGVRSRTPGARSARCRRSSRRSCRSTASCPIVAVRAADGEIALLPARREPPPRRDPARVVRACAGAHRTSSRRRPRRTRARSLERLDYVGVLAIELFQRGRRPARQRDGAAGAQLRALDDRGRGRRASSRTTCARSAGCRWGGVGVREHVAMVNLIGREPGRVGDPDDPR